MLTSDSNAHRECGSALYVSPLDVTVRNGMLQRQHQVLASLAERFPSRLDLITLASPPAAVRRWLSNIGIRARVLDGPYVAMARANATVWYAGNVAACNKARLINHFVFPIRTPLPKLLIERYTTIVSFYAWAFLLLGLNRAGSKVVVDLGDVMGERHDRIGARRWISLSAGAERAIVASNARCIAISEDDRQEFERLYKRPLPVVPFAHAESQALLDLPRQCDRTSVGFLAARGYQNEVIVRTLSSSDFLEPLASSRIRLVMAGGVCDIISETQRERLLRAGATILGGVSSINEFYSRVGTVLNPVGPSTGVKIKSVEALLAGRLLITTRYGADAALMRAFESRITVVDWPLTPTQLADATIRTLAGAREAPADESAKAPELEYLAFAKNRLASMGL
jgi:hypothetical protein